GQQDISLRSTLRRASTMEAGNGVVTGVLLFQMITSLFPDSSDIGLMDAEVGYNQASQM
ncbi:hypothetical protein M9458_037603, partial [Cirrhinus mrigala]